MRLPRQPWTMTLAACAVLVLVHGAAAEDVAPLLARIKAVGKEGAGNLEAARAWNDLTRRGPDVLLDILTALDDANPVAANYLRSAVEAIADRAVAAAKPLPGGRLEAFVRDTRHAGPARRLAYDWLVRVDATAPDRLLPGMLHDPGAELRRDAVAVVLNDAQKLFDKDNKAAATGAYQKALKAARDGDQVKLIAGRLKALGVEVDLTTQFGFVTRWMVAGPFDNRDGAGFHKAFAPERGIDLGATYQGKDNKEVRWTEYVCTAPLGQVDFNKAFGELKGVTAYAVAVVLSPAERPVELRAGSNDAIRIYLNGKEIFAREEYHHGVRMDQHVGRGVLRAGRNEILVKVCQNEQTEEWTRQWSFQLRVCDAIGGAVPLTVVNGKNAAPAGGGE